MANEKNYKESEIHDENEVLDPGNEQKIDKQTADEAGEHGEQPTSPSALRAIRKLTADEDNTVSSHTPVTLASILGGDFFGGKWFRRQFWFIVMIVGMLIVYISNRYSCQQAMIETKRLNDTLLDRRYKALTRSSQLKEKTRRSYIEESLVDTTIRTSATPSFNLLIEEE